MIENLSYVVDYCFLRGDFSIYGFLLYGPCVTPKTAVNLKTATTKYVSKFGTSYETDFKLKPKKLLVKIKSC